MNSFISNTFINSLSLHATLQLHLVYCTPYINKRFDFITLRSSLAYPSVLLIIHLCNTISVYPQLHTTSSHFISFCMPPFEMNICICVIWFMGVRVKVKYAFIITRIYFDYFIFIFIRILFCSFPFKNELYKDDAYTYVSIHIHMCSIHNTVTSSAQQIKLFFGFNEVQVRFWVINNEK